MTPSQPLSILEQQLKSKFRQTLKKLKEFQQQNRNDFSAMILSVTTKTPHLSVNNNFRL